MSDTKETKKELFFEIIRFLIVGGTATLVEYVLFALLSRLFPFFELNFFNFNQAIAFTISLLVNWFLSIIFVYKNVKNKEESRSLQSFIIFAIIGIVGLIISSSGIALGEKIFNPTNIIIFGKDLTTWIIKCILTIIVLIFNYILRKILIFK